MNAMGSFQYLADDYPIKSEPIKTTEELDSIIASHLINKKKIVLLGFDAPLTPISTADNEGINAP